KLVEFVKMEHFRLIIISYYDDLIREIDIKTEELLANENIGNHDKDEINQNRTEWIMRLQQMRDQNLLYFEQNIDLRILTNQNEISNYILFENEFLIFPHYPSFLKENALLILNFNKNAKSWIKKNRGLKYASQIEILNRMGYFNQHNQMFYIYPLNKNTLEYCIRKKFSYQLFSSRPENNLEFSDENYKELNLYRVLLGSIGDPMSNQCILIKLENFQILDLSKCGIKIINKFAFKDLFNLKSLYLNNNEIGILEENTFKDLKILNVLNLSCNCLRILDVKMLNGLSNLEKLYLSSNKFLCLQSITFRNLDKVLFLEFTDCNLRTLKPNIFIGMYNLSHLDVSNNLISFIQKDTFKHIYNLKKINFSNNSLIKIDEKKILINDTISINNFNDAKKLEHLNLGWNKLVEFGEKAFYDMKNLRYLSLRSNNIEKIDKTLFDDLINLETLDLSFNSLRVIEENTFLFLHKLKNLYMSINKFESIENNYFDGLECLENLSISNCQIDKIDPESFKNLDSLKKLDLSNNPFEKEYIDKIIFNHHVDLTPFHCDIDQID
ncbi:unnamed protein product, partial [Brachionus calyciflorus]